MLHSFFIQMAPPVLLFYTTSITFFTTNLLLHFFFAAAAARKERASQAPAVSSCCNCLRLQEPLHPLEILHKLQRSSCFFQPLKSSRPEKSRLLKLTNARRRHKPAPPPSLPKYFRLAFLLPVESKAANYSANLRCSFKADFLKKYEEQ